MKQLSLLLGSLVVCLATASGLRADLAAYSQNFETLSGPTALSGDGWLVFGTDHIGNYGPFPAPNGGQAFSSIATGAGGPNQGLRYLNVYSDYGNSGAHGTGNFVNALVFQQQTIGAGNVGQTAMLSFDYRANPANVTNGNTTTFAFIKVLKQTDNSFNELGVVEWDTTVAPDWQTKSINLVIEAGWAGELLQFGFRSVATNFNDSGRFYDNISFSFGSAPGTTVTVDPGQNWLGYMNVFEINRTNNPPTPGGFVFGEPWGFADLTASFDGSGCLTLGVNTIGDPNPFWYVGGGGPGALGNKWMDANGYVEVTNDPAFSGVAVTFTGTVKSNTLTANHTARAFIRDFAPDYSSFQESSVVLTGGQFSISLNTLAGAGRHVQYGFNVQGENVWVTDAAAFGTIVVGDDAGPTASVVDRYAYHRNSAFAGVSVSNALDTSKQLAKESGSPQELGLVNVINSSRGINGIVFDIQDLAGSPTADDFEFQVSPTGAFNVGANPPGGWAGAPAPESVSVVAGSPDRVIIVWADNLIANRWLRITVKANSNTGLSTPEVYYLGHLLGETTGLSDGVYTVAFADITSIRSSVGQSVDAGNAADIDKNGTVAFADISVMRSNVGAQLSNITIPAAAP